MRKEWRSGLGRLLKALVCVPKLSFLDHESRVDSKQRCGSWSNLNLRALAGPVALVSGAPIEDYVRDFGEQWIDDYLLSQFLWVSLLDPTNPPVDFFPLLRFVPAFLTQWKHKAPEARKYLMTAYHGVLEQGRKSMKRKGGSFSPLALIPRLLSEKENQDMSVEQENDFAVYMGGLL
jgi:hypothetical protein